MDNQIQNLDVIILCGGLGTRLKPLVNDRPKSMVEIDGRPFLDILIEYVADYGFKRFILCIGYKREIIKNYYAQRASPVEIIYSQEEKPLGTGGALKNAKPLIHNETFLVANGDTICKVDLNAFLKFHLEKRGILSMVLVKADNSPDYGIVTLDNSSRINGFNKKRESLSSSLMNAGIYLMHKDIFSYMPESSCFSLEDDIFPEIHQIKSYGFLNTHEFIDIGTPERFRQAIKILKKK